MKQPQLVAVALRVATYNLSGDSGLSVNQEQNRLLNQQQVEVAGLQEINWNNYRFSEQPYNTLDHFTDFPNHFFGSTMDFAGGQYGNGIVSQMPFMTMTDRQFEIAHSSAMTTLTGIELRAWQRVTLVKAGCQIAFYNTHLSYESESMRLKQIASLKETVLADPMPYKIITGDFNIDQNTTDWRLFTPELQLVNGQAGVWRDTFREFDSKMKVKSIDNVLVSSNITIQRVTTIDSSLSDHRPLVVDLCLN